jgi:hypothetical protein
MNAGGPQGPLPQLKRGAAYPGALSRTLTRRSNSTKCERLAIRSRAVLLLWVTTEKERFRGPFSAVGPGSGVSVPTSGSVLCGLGPQGGPDRVEVDEDGGPNCLEC